MKKKSKLIIGRFYLIYGGIPHPSQVYMYDSKHKTYLSIKFGTTKGKHMRKIHPIQKGYKEGFVNNRPFEGIRSDYGDREIEGMKVDEKDKAIIESIKQEKPKQTKGAKKRYKDK